MPLLFIFLFVFKARKRWPHHRRGLRVLRPLICLVIFASIAQNLKMLAKLFQSFNPCPFLPSVAADDRKQFQCLNIAFLAKLDHYFWNPFDAKKVLAFSKT